MSKYIPLFLEEVNGFINDLPDDHQARIKAAITSLERGDFGSAYIKTLRTPIKELIIGKYRLIFFINNINVYFISIFIKKTAKTPKKEIDNAERKFKAIISSIK